MDRLTKIRRVIYSPWFLAIILTIIIIPFLPAPGLRYKLLIEPADKRIASDYYIDLNSDSITEVVRMAQGEPYSNIKIFDNDLFIFDQINFADSIIPNQEGLSFGDYDHDHIREIYIFTVKKDSLFLNAEEFFEPNGLKLRREFITKVSVVDNVVTSTVEPAGFYDMNADGYDELYFSITTGFGKVPRHLYCYNIASKDLIRSKFTGVNFHKPELVDADGDGKPEIIGTVRASGNYDTPVPYSDNSSWLMVYNEKLEFEFPPVEFPGIANNLETKAWSDEGFRGYVALFAMYSAKHLIEPGIMFFSLDGKMIRERPYSDFGFNMNTLLFVVGQRKYNRIYIMQKELLELNSRLEVINRKKSPFDSSYNGYVEDINDDGNKEFLLYSMDDKRLIILDMNLKVIASSSFDAPGNIFILSHSISGDHKNKLHLQSDANGYFIQMVKNPMVYAGYMEYPGVYLLIFIFIISINRINTYNISQKENLKRRLLTLQLQGIKAQLDPHFTFNSLNSVASLIYLQDREKAYFYMNKFTTLLRVMLNDAEKTYRSLEEELSFVKTYLELEKLRFGDRFSYEFQIGEEVILQQPVPKLVLQSFAENAIKHGIMDLESGGLLRISISNEGDSLKLTIEDNGIGRKASEGKSSSTGKGLKLTGEFYDILNQLRNKPIRRTITDLFDESGKPAGTRVEVWVPDTKE